MQAARDQARVPEHPESQGQVEKQNQLLNHVRCLCGNDLETWPKLYLKCNSVVIHQKLCYARDKGPIVVIMLH